MKWESRALKNMVCLLAVTVFSASCVTLEGRLDVKQAMSAKKKAGFLNLKTKEIRIEPDLYEAKLKVNSDKSFTLKLEGRENILIPLKSEKDLNLPKNGRVFISHTEINQPFDVSGFISTDISNSERQSAIESCTVTVTENHCKKICETEQTCKIECKDEAVQLEGHQYVEFHYRTIHRDLSMDLLKQEKGEVLASFRGTNTDSFRVTDFEESCHLR
jgi:hypothetical protein